MLNALQQSLRDPEEKQEEAKVIGQKNDQQIVKYKSSELRDKENLNNFLKVVVTEQENQRLQKEYHIVTSIEETRGMLGQILHDKQQEIEEADEKKKHEKELGVWKYLFELFLVFYTSTNVILMVIIENKELVSWIYSSSTVVRVIFYVYIGFHLANTKWACIKEFIRMDDLFILSILCQVAYNFQNSSAENVKTGPFIISAVSYFFLVMSFCGMVRCHLKFMKWNRWRHMAYKWLLIYSIVYYMILGTLTLSGGAKGYNKDLYLLYVFTYLGYLCQLLSLINGVELDEDAQKEYEVQELAIQKRMEEEQIKQLEQAEQKENNNVQIQLSDMKSDTPSRIIQ